VTNLCLPTRFSSALAIATLCLFASLGQAANEAALVKLWQQHIHSPEQHADVIAACRQFIADNPADALVPVTQGIEAWHLLKDNRQPEAIALLEAHLSRESRGISGGAAILARAWLSRLDREDVKRALQRYYRKEVKYPDTLEALANYPGMNPELQPRMTDRWDRPWNYQPTGFKSAPGFLNQRYSITSSRLGESSDIAAALAQPYGGEIRARATRIVTTASGTRVVEFGTWQDDKEQGLRFLLSPGRESNGLFLAAIGDSLIIVCDQTHWKLLPKP